MRNLKKILALALALVMSLSLMATANAFTDDDSITDTYETAVTVLSGLKVFQGYDDGSFLPQGAITRAEVAAIIYRIVTGDVADTQVGIYADYNKFDDVASTSWYAGYVNFCANAEYIKGYDARTFGPNDPVTGYQALAMILRALGYDKNGEFTGTNWQVQTAAVGEQRGITKNITAGTLGVPATREVVAEILFRAILVPKATYTPAFGYQTSVNGVENTSIGWDTFELEDITGVVVANEYADLYDTKPLRAGYTELNVDGESYMIELATTLEDIGEAQAAYITGETVLAIGDAGNTVFETGAETDISTSSKCEDVAGLERDDTTEEYINFANETYEYVTDIRVSYWLDTNENQLQDADDETGMFRKDHKLTADEVEILEGIFKDDDKMDGWVVVGTKELSEANDISDDITWREFCREYFQDTDALIEEVNGADNGEWLKVIDNDGDGVADYIFRIDFAMSVIERISKDNEYTLASLDDNDDEVSFQDTKIDGGDIATEDELAEGDVVLYTYIDGVYYMSIAEMVTETVDEDGINSKTETMTCGGTDYVQSHIGYTDRTTYYSDVTDAHTEVTYDLYLDHFGYVRLFIESDYSAFMLLTDGYYETDRRDEAFKAMYWNVEASEEQEIDVVGSDADDFITTADRNNDGDRETWRRLVDAGEFYLGYPDGDDTYITNIAGYSAGDDGYTLIPADDATRRAEYTVQELDDEQLETDALNDELLYSMAGGRIQTTTNTEYYLVIKATDRFGAEYVDDVITWTGYANVPDDAALAAGAVAYAVTHDGDGRWALYDVADVVVFETDPTADHDTYFVYTHNNWSFTNPNPDPDTIEYVWGLGYDETGAIADQRVDVEDGAQEVHDNGVIQFYEIYDNTDADIISANYADKGIHAGRVSVLYDVSGNDYMQIDAVEGGEINFFRFNPENIPIYKVVGQTAVDGGEYDVEKVENWDDIRLGSRMILFADDTTVKYAITVDMSTYTDRWMNIPYTDVVGLYNAIEDDANYVATATLSFYGVGDDTANDQNKTAVTGAANTIVVSYADALANSKGLQVSGCDVVSITSNGVSATIPAVPGIASVTYTVVTEDGYGDRTVWTLTVEAARSDAKLYKDILDSDDSATAGDEATSALLNMPAEKYTIQEYIDQFRADEGATVTWNFTTNADVAAGKDEPTFSFTGMTATGVPAGVTTDEIAWVEVTVTAEDGTTKTPYKNEAVSDIEALAAAKANAIEAVKDAIWAGAQAQAATDGVTGLTKEAVLADNSVELTSLAGSHGTGYETVAAALETWTAYIDSLTTATAINGWVTASVEPAGSLDYQVGVAYVTQLQADDAAGAAAAMAAAVTAVNTKTLDAATVTRPTIEAVKAAIKAAVAEAINNEDITINLAVEGTNFPTVLTNNTAGTWEITSCEVTLELEGTSDGWARFNVNVPYNFFA